MLMRPLIPIAITLTVAGVLCGQNASGEDDLRKAEKSWAAAVIKRDHAALDRMYSPDLIYAHSSGVVESKREYLDKLKTGAQKYDAIEHQSMTVKVFGDAGVVHSKVRMAGATKGQPFDNQLMMLHVWVKQGGAWRLAAHQTTRLQQ